jgi:hypothetical protein
VVDNIPGDEPQGDFALVSTGGDPLTGVDNFRILSDRVDPYPQDMRTIVAVDWSPAGGGRFLHFGSRADGTDIKVGDADPVRQKIVSEWKDSGSVLLMTETLTLLRDVVEMRYRLKNIGTVSHTFGLRVMLDVRPNATALDVGENSLPETPLFVPGSEPVVNEVKYAGGNVPAKWWCGVPTAQPVTQMGGFLANFADARRPDELHFGNLVNLQNSPWDFTPAAQEEIQDAGVAVRWNPVRLSPNESTEFVTYFGYASASGDYSSPFVLAAVSVPRMTLNAGDNPGTPGTTERFYVSPDPFEVRGYVYNVSDLPQGNATLYLTLPDGFEFAPGEAPSKIIDVVPAHSEKMVSWNLHATGSPAGTLTFLLSANVSPPAARAVSRDVLVPPVDNTNLLSGVQMFSVPFVLANTTPDAALSLSPSATLRLARWDPTDEKYLIFPEPGFGLLQRGRAYWLGLDVQSTLNLAGASAPGSGDVIVPVEEGWNQIGNPFELPIEWGRVKVAYQDQTLGLTDAVRMGLLRSTLFRWDPVSHEYRWSLDTSYQFQPWAGYWIKANLPFTLVFERLEITRERLPSKEGTLETSRAFSGGWSLNLVATAGGDKAKCVVGASPEARDGYDSQDVESPPPSLGTAVGLSILHPDWGPAAGSYLQDMRLQRSSGVQQWEVEVWSKKPSQEVMLSWPDLRAVQKDLSMYLEREDTRQRVSLRTTQGLAVNTGATGKVRLVLSTQTAGAEVLVVSTPQVLLTKGSLSFSFVLSTGAQVEANISNLAGVEIRKLASGVELGSGSQTVVWDVRDAEGKRVPPGMYVLEIEALTSDGQRFVSSRTFSVQ